MAFGCVLFVVAATSLFAFAAIRSAGNATAASDQAHLVIVDLERVIAAQFDEAQAVRGFLITDGIERHAMLYGKAVKRFNQQMTTARHDATGKPDMLALLDKVDAAGAAWQREIGDPEINLGRNPKTMSQAIDIAKSAHSSEMMKAFRATAKEAQTKFAEWASSAQAEQGHANWFLQLSQIIGSLVALMVALYAGHQLSQRIAFPIRILNGCMKALAQGDTKVDVPSMGEGDEVGDMAHTVQIFKANAVEKMRLEAQAAEQIRMAEEEQKLKEIETQKYIEAHNRFVTSITSALESLSEGDLTCRLTQAFSEEYEKIRANFNVSAEKLQQVMLSVSTNTHAIRSGTKEIAVAADDLSRRTEQQAASLEETAAALGEITTTVRKTAQGATHARQVVSTAKSDAEKGSGVVRQAITAMSGIEKSSQQIGQIIGVIDEIAFQTNLLALNAGVEAARAGDAGRGFAVVASEVRALAQRSAEAAKEIKGLISASTIQVEQGVDLVAETGKALERIFTQVAEIDAIVSEIATSAQDQATGLQEVNTAVNQMDQVTQQNAAMVEESTAASHTLSQETEELTRLIGRFQVGAPAAGHGDHVVAMPRGGKAAPRQAMKTVASRGGGAAPKPQAQSQHDEWEEF
ncbi:methyl-accepting chemotaxis protein [Methylovirgula sp. HY1]|uniref:methyl-accepting chemotaxis protein n=1 Tax=Methylovirgula sp. HY1 TaxID=2822761 RepID=UPI001C5B12F3|nr:methyl-accepting chemotaxis protein [Methylovirgula sp. HY1]